MPDWPEHDSWAHETAGISSTTGTTVTASGSTNTKGSYAQLVAATVNDAIGIIVSIIDNSARAQYLLDIAVGGAGSEQVVVPNLMVGPAYSNSPQGQGIFFPLSIPAGSRIAARCAADSASATLAVIVHLVRGRWAASHRADGVVTSYGANAADSGGTSVDPGGSANTKGSWAELVDPTTRPINQIVMAVSNQKNNADTTARFLFDVGIGAAASEQVVIPDIPVAKNNNTDSLGTVVYGPWPIEIPVGSRLAVRAQCSITDATDRLSDVVIYGIG